MPVVKCCPRTFQEGLWKLWEISFVSHEDSEMVFSWLQYVIYYLRFVLTIYLWLVTGPQSTSAGSFTRWCHGGLRFPASSVWPRFSNSTIIQQAAAAVGIGRWKYHWCKHICYWYIKLSCYRVLIYCTTEHDSCHGNFMPGSLLVQGIWSLFFYWISTYFFW